MIRRSLATVWLAGALLGCATVPSSGGAVAEADDGAPGQEVERQGPFHVACWRNEDGEQVFATTLYRVRRRMGEIDSWSYEAANGLRFRGRFAPPNLTCMITPVHPGTPSAPGIPSPDGAAKQGDTDAGRRSGQG